MTAAASLLSTILAVAAVSSAPYERSLRANLGSRTGVRVTLVSCPRRVKLAAGTRFTCFARFASHDRSPVRVRLTDDQGHYTARLRDLLLRHLERQLRRAGHARFRCPKRRAVAKGDRFTCRAKTTVARVRQLGDGRVRYRFADRARGRRARMAVHRGCLTATGGPGQCWRHGPVRRVTSGAARRGQPGAAVVGPVG